MGIEQSPVISHDRGPGVVGEALIGIALGALTIWLVGCSAKLGPGEYGWASWDVCGYEGGVAAELNVMAVGGRLGCTNLPETTVVDEVEATP